MTEPVKLACPTCGSFNVGTNESVSAVATCDIFLNDEGNIAYEHNGHDTVCWWDSMTTEDSEYCFNCLDCCTDFSEGELKAKLEVADQKAKGDSYANQ